MGWYVHNACPVRKYAVVGMAIWPVSVVFRPLYDIKRSRTSVIHTTLGHYSEYIDSAVVVLLRCRLVRVSCMERACVVVVEGCVWISPSRGNPISLSLPALSLGSTSERGATSSNLRWVGYSQLSAVAVMLI